MNSMLFQCKVNALKEQLQHFYKMKRKRLLDNIKRIIHKKQNCLLWIAHLKMLLWNNYLI